MKKTTKQESENASAMKDKDVDKPKEEKLDKEPTSSVHKKVCIMCEKEVDGKLVADDLVINSIRWIKQKFNVATNRTLVVCESCMENYKKKRAGYEKEITIRVGFAGIVVLLMTGFPLFFGRFSLETTIFGIMLAVLIFVSAAFIHIPRLKQEKSGGENP